MGSEIGWRVDWKLGRPGKKRSHRLSIAATIRGVSDVLWAAVIGGGFALGGVIFGWIGASLQEHWRRSHEDRTRWHSERFERYAEVLHQADAFRDAMTRYRAEADYWGQRGRDPYDEAWPEHPSSAPLDKACREAELVATSGGSAYRHLVRLRQAAKNVPHMPLPPTSDIPDEEIEYQEAEQAGDAAVRGATADLNWDDAFAALREASGAFEKGAKSELGIRQQGLLPRANRE